MVESLLVANNLDRCHVTSLMIPALQHLTKRSLAEHVNDLVPVLEMVMRDNEVVASLIIKAVVVGRNFDRRWLFVTIRPDIVNVLVLQYLLFLVRRQIARIQ